jgi:hypothetical protein
VKDAPIEVPNAETAEAMREARKGGLRSFDSVLDLMADLDAEAFPLIRKKRE